MIETFTPVLVLRSTYHGGLGIVRSLGRLGVPVYVLDVNPSTPAFRSRFCRGRFQWDLDGNPPTRSLAYLKSIARQLGVSPILIPTTDAAALFVETHADELRPWFVFPPQPAGLAETLCSKKAMHHLAIRMGIPTPLTCFPQSSDDVSHFGDHTGFPVILKPIDGHKVRGSGGGKKKIAWTKSELLDAYYSMEDAGQSNIMVQEFIPGGEEANWMFNGYFDHQSDCIFGITGKKIRQYKAYAGVTSLGVCQANPVLHTLTCSFMKSIGYKGMLDCGFRYDARDGKYKAFDINPRIGSTFRLFVSSTGMDVARAGYLHLTSQSVSAGLPVEGRKWMVEDLDLGSSLQYWQDGNLSAVDWIRSFGGVKETAFAAWDDPLPALAMCGARLQELGGLALKRIGSMFPASPRPSPGTSRVTPPKGPESLLYGNESESQ